jgi:hypothetical protein
MAVGRSFDFMRCSVRRAISAHIEMQRIAAALAGMMPGLPKDVNRGFGGAGAGKAAVQTRCHPDPATARDCGRSISGIRPFF